MKLLFDATELSYFEQNSTNKAGMFYVALNLFREFQKMDIDITFCCDFKRYEIFKNIEYFKNVPILPENSILNGFISKVLFFTDKLPPVFRYAFIVAARIYEGFFYKSNKKNLAQLKGYDVYFSSCTPPSKEIQQSDLLKFRMLHDAIPIVESGMPKSPKDWYYKIYTTINNKDYYDTNSDYTRKDILKYFPFIKDNHIKTTLLGANENFVPSKELSPIKGKYIFSLCSLGKRKNLEFAIKNFFKFIEKNNITDLKLVLGGSVWNKYKPVLNKILNKYDREKVVLAGYIDEKELPKYYSNALCFIYPSLYEGFGLPVLEAMQCGCPVITSNTTSLPEVIGDAGIQINPESDEEIIAAYEKMYFDSEFREECKRKGLERARQFSWQKCANEILDFINNTLTV